MSINDKCMKAAMGLLLTFLLFYTLSLIPNGQAAMSPFSGSVFIRNDGSIDPSTAPLQRTSEVYTLVGSFVGNITVQKDNIIIDGAGKTVEGTAIGNEV